MTEFIDDKRSKAVNVEATCIGLKGAGYCRRNDIQIFHQTEINERVFTTASMREISGRIFERFVTNTVQEVYIVYNGFISTINQETRTLRLLPLPEAENDEKTAIRREIQTEPQALGFIISASELYLYYSLCTALLNSRLSEQAARMTAMENATNNSEDLIGRYNLQRNRARQAAITSEITEIISGEEALS